MNEIANFVNKNKIGNLATCVDDIPNVRPIELLCSDKEKFLFYLSEDSNAYNELRKNSNISFCLTDKDYNYSKITATAVNTHDSADKDYVLKHSSFANNVFADKQKMKVFSLENGTGILHKYMNDDIIKVDI